MLLYIEESSNGACVAIPLDWRFWFGGFKLATVHSLTTIRPASQIRLLDKPVPAGLPCQTVLTGVVRLDSEQAQRSQSTPTCPIFTFLASQPAGRPVKCADN